MVGTWTIKGENKESPIGPAAEFTGTERCDWFEGGFALVCESEYEGTLGPAKQLTIMTYNDYEQAYQIYQVSDRPTRLPLPTVTIDGDTWTATGDMEIDGRSVTLRATMVVSPTEQTQFNEVSENGGPWTRISEATATKVE